MIYEAGGRVNILLRNAAEGIGLTAGKSRQQAHDKQKQRSFAAPLFHLKI